MGIILSEDLSIFGMPTYIKGHIPFGQVGEEGRITITPKEDSDGRIFDRCFIEVNFLLQDVEQEANIGLDEIERIAYEFFHEAHVGEYEGQWYRYTYSRRSRERDEKLSCSYVHFQILFETLNTL